MRVVRAAVRKFVAVQLAEQHRPSVAEFSHDRAIRLGNPVAKDLRRRCGADAGGSKHVLERDRNAVQRATILAGHDFGVGAPGVGDGPIGGDGDVGVYLRIQSFDALQVRLGEINRR